MKRYKIEINNKETADQVIRIVQEYGLNFIGTVCDIREYITDGNVLYIEGDRERERCLLWGGVFYEQSYFPRLDSDNYSWIPPCLLRATIEELYGKSIVQQTIEQALEDIKETAEEKGFAVKYMLTRK